MGYWNRDLCSPYVGGFPGGHRSPAHGVEPFKAWHDDCFPVYKPTTAEKFGTIGDARDVYASHIYGGVENMIELALNDEWYADRIERDLTDETRWTPDGYAWANWSMGTLCEECGTPC